jgi:hypothetical protein
MPYMRDNDYSMHEGLIAALQAAQDSWGTDPGHGLASPWPGLRKLAPLALRGRRNGAANSRARGDHRSSLPYAQLAARRVESIAPDNKASILPGGSRVKDAARDLYSTGGATHRRGPEKAF